MRALLRAGRGTLGDDTQHHACPARLEIPFLLKFRVSTRTFVATCGAWRTCATVAKALAARLWHKLRGRYAFDFVDEPTSRALVVRNQRAFLRANDSVRKTSPRSRNASAQSITPPPQRRVSESDRAANCATRRPTRTAQRWATTADCTMAPRKIRSATPSDEGFPREQRP